MIDYYVLQALFSDQDALGFEISKAGGFCRHLAIRVGCSPAEVVETLRYAKSRGWVKQTGYFGSIETYSVRERPASRILKPGQPEETVAIFDHVLTDAEILKYAETMATTRRIIEHHEEGERPYRMVAIDHQVYVIEEV